MLKSQLQAALDAVNARILNRSFVSLPLDFRERSAIWDYAFDKASSLASYGTLRESHADGERVFDLILEDSSILPQWDGILIRYSLFPDGEVSTEEIYGILKYA